MSSKNSVLRFAKLSEFAFEPLKGSVYAAGWDLRSAHDYVVPARGRIIAQTDIQIAVPNGCYGRVAPRSGLAAKFGIDTGAGVIDADYRGNVGVVLFNHNDLDFTIKRGDRIAQLICEKIEMAALVEDEKLDDTVRGSNGFGSTGGFSHVQNGNSH
ncbi:unnamed protein product [Rotaria socialis]|uniref:Deoxyuridine 5'-triphosphate nucleotidohydrolase n=1 Tax=Rotaria socialis TaxID=392032 RepID=A0A820BC89_9BILA|nr:unnamed protein product [Rotaria socialis]CAF3326359.1 unnamed protein product [Rotaria socialis]CAF3395112.1 unnamed protein product [Rotaria socialis]CAF3607529.1 unnamed protein product [Rotaria socialis]CAF3773527.1 unnamed protein product [Rotaria socialis]